MGKVAVIRGVKLREPIQRLGRWPVNAICSINLTPYATQIIYTHDQCCYNVPRVPAVCTRLHSCITSIHQQVYTQVCSCRKSARKPGKNPRKSTTSRQTKAAKIRGHVTEKKWRQIRIRIDVRTSDSTIHQHVFSSVFVITKCCVDTVIFTRLLSTEEENRRVTFEVKKKWRQFRKLEMKMKKLNQDFGVNLLMFVKLLRRKIIKKSKQFFNYLLIIKVVLYFIN